MTLVYDISGLFLTIRSVAGTAGMGLGGWVGWMGWRRKWAILS